MLGHAHSVNIGHMRTFVGDYCHRTSGMNFSQPPKVTSLAKISKIPYRYNKFGRIVRKAHGTQSTSRTMNDR